MASLLMVDDDPDILRINRTYFEKRKYRVDTAESAEEAAMLLGCGRYDCIILDVKMEGMDGYRFCEDLRRTADIPVIFLTSLAEEECLERGFLAGGDDYLTKPYSLRELELRVQARVRTAIPHASTDNGLFLGELHVDRGGKQAYIRGQSLQLTANEFEILLLLVQNPGTPFTQEEIYRRIWGEDGRYNSHSVQTLIVRIRRKLAALHPETAYIKTAWGRGYLFCRRAVERGADSHQETSSDGRL